MLKKNESEKQRIEKMMVWEKKLWSHGVNYVAGVDEAGRGPVAGPVVAAVVIFPTKIFIPGIRDSKKLSPSVRSDLYPLIKKQALTYAYGVVHEKIIDEINILQATYRAMQLAIDKLSLTPQHILVDGNRKNPWTDIEQTTIVGGDNISFTIASASIIAKVTRDSLMLKYHKRYPNYGFAKHKGYPTREHIEAIKRYGFCPIHRKSFRIRALEHNNL